jgi:hypothetical protein
LIDELDNCRREYGIPPKNRTTRYPKSYDRNYHFAFHLLVSFHSLREQSHIIRGYPVREDGQVLP